MGWVECSACGYPHLQVGSLQSACGPRFECAACGVGEQHSGGLFGNPLGAWDIGWDGESLRVGRSLPAVAARGTDRVLSISGGSLVADGLSTASSTELGAARVREKHLRVAANIPEVA